MQNSSYSCCIYRKEITTYAELNPVTRLLILKAVCELRGEVMFSSHMAYPGHFLCCINFLLYFYFICLHLIARGCVEVYR